MVQILNKFYCAKAVYASGLGEVDLTLEEGVPVIHLANVPQDENPENNFHTGRYYMVQIAEEK